MLAKHEYMLLLIYRWWQWTTLAFQWKQGEDDKLSDCGMSEAAYEHDHEAQLGYEEQKGYLGQEHDRYKTSCFCIDFLL